MNQTISWPAKTREFQNHHFDSTVWNNFRFRDDDIIISTYAKSGTTWMQQIVAQLVFGGNPDVDVAQCSPWLDLRFPPKALKLFALNAQPHRRFLKTHLPIDALVFSPKAKYLYIGRDARDVVWSMYNHHASANEKWYRDLNETPGLVGPKIGPPCSDIRQYWREWMDNDGFPWWPFWENVRGWWAIRHLPNVKFVHFVDLKRDMPNQIRQIADFLEIEIGSGKWDEIVEHCSFDWMKRNAGKHVGGGGEWLVGGAETFINKGINGRWADTLNALEISEYEARAIQELGEECAHWLANGALPS
jgi:aryl sulfotransferase